jgi:hypothetical protein
MEGEDLGKLFDDGEEDVLQYFDLTKTRSINGMDNLVELQLSSAEVAQLDAEARRLNTTR